MNKNSMVNFKWAQGEDLLIELAYKEGNDARRASLLHLQAGYKIRMDLVTTSKELVYTASSDNANVILTNKAPNITIVLPRALTLPGGAVFTRMPDTNNFVYDIFLRNTLTDRQVKILEGNVTIDRSNTLWA